MTKVLESAKAIAALIGSIATTLLAVVGPDDPWARVLTIVLAVATPIATYVIPNAERVVESYETDPLLLGEVE